MWQAISTSIKNSSPTHNCIYLTCFLVALLHFILHARLHQRSSKLSTPRRCHGDSQFNFGASYADAHTGQELHRQHVGSKPLPDDNDVCMCCAVLDGTVHPLTATTLSFLKRLFTYRSALQILFFDSSDR